MRSFLLALLAISTAAHADRDNTHGITLQTAAEVKLGKDALERFNTTPQFLNQHPDQRHRYDAIQKRCITVDLAGCIEYLLTNKQLVLSAVPDNPAYWSNFHDVLSASPFGIEAQYMGDFNHPRANWNSLLEAMPDWFYRDLAMHKTIEPAKFERYYRNLRRSSAASETLIERMIYLASIGIAHVQMQQLMAIYAAKGERKNIEALRTLAKPYTTAERSLRRSLVGESVFAQTNLARLEQIDPGEFLHPDLIPLGSVEEVKAQLQQLYAAQADELIELLGALSERSWSDYWRLPPELEFGKEDEYFGPAPVVYLSYAAGIRSSEIYIPLLQALADIHLGLVPPGEPQRSAPPYWDWSWQEERRAICLSPNAFVQGKSEYSITSPACVVYVDSTVVRDFLQQY